MEYKGLQEALERFKYDMQDERTELLFKIAYKLGFENGVAVNDMSNHTKEDVDKLVDKWTNYALDEGRQSDVRSAIRHAIEEYTYIR